MKWISLVLCLVCGVPVTNLSAQRYDAPTVPPGQTRTDKAIRGGALRWWGSRPDQAKVLTASFLGGQGNEFLVDGGFLPNGKIILVGNGVGGDFTLPVGMSVLGRDGRTPASYTPQPKMTMDRKTRTEDVKKDALGQIQYMPLRWNDDDATGFMVRLSEDGKTVEKAVRLPWGSGAITSAVVDQHGDVFIAGRAMSGTSRLASNHQTAPSTNDKIKDPGCDATFVAKLDAGLSKIEWVRIVTGPAYAPRLSLTDKGNIAASLGDLRTFDRNGKLLSTVTVEGGLGLLSSVSPTTGDIATGSEHHSSTGREPWRCPILRINHPDGSLKYELMDWRGPLVGLDSLRLVSDTATRMVTHDSEGNILAMFWSDGGNSVALQQPTDLRRGVGTRGTGLNAAGAGATSFAYLMRIEPVNYQVIGWTMWATRFGSKANGAKIERVVVAPDGTTCFAGSTSWGLTQTEHHLGNTEPGGAYMAVLCPNMTGVRFSSTVAGVNMAELSEDNSWGIFTGVVNGKERAVFLAGAGKDGDNYGLVTETPTVNPLQNQFGGGISDGWFTILDLSAPSPQAEPFTATVSPLDARRTASRIGKEKKKSRNHFEVEDGMIFTLSPTFPRWVTCDAEFRHRDSVTVWPNFFYGKPVSGELKWSEQHVRGSFTIECTRLAHNKGLQDRRVLGELISKDPNQNPPLRLTIDSIEPTVRETFTGKDKRDRPIEYEVFVAPARGKLTIGNVTLPVTPQLTIQPATVTEKGIPCLRISAWLRLKGSDLGLTGDMAQEEIQVRISTQAMLAGSEETFRKKKRGK